MKTSKRNETSPLKEYVRFGLTGILNTGVDFATLNLLILALGSNVKGAAYVICKIISFSAALINSYMLNKHWVFGAKENARSLEEGGKFFAVSVAGFLINIAASYLIFSGLSASDSMSAHAAANIGSVVGTALVLIWNFAGYKFFVFKTS